MAGAPPNDFAAVLRAAGAGEQRAWDTLVDRYGRLVWATVRAYRLPHHDASDVVQTTWLRLVEHLDDVRNPEHVGAWLATTARRESLRALRSSARVIPTDDELTPQHAAPDALDAALLRRERDATLWRAFAALSERCQALLRLLASDPTPAYEEVSAALDMPVGSIGPTRARCLERLRGFLEPGGISEA